MSEKINSYRSLSKLDAWVCSTCGQSREFHAPGDHVWVPVLQEHAPEPEFEGFCSCVPGETRYMRDCGRSEHRQLARAERGEPVPEPNDGPGGDGNHVETGECFACLVGVATGPESHGKGCVYAAPEPPKLDPEPWVDLSSGTRAHLPPSPILALIGKWQFAPSPECIQDRAAYEVQS